MKSDGSVQKQSWVPPTVTKLAIGKHTKSTVAVDRGLESGASNSVVEPQPPREPATKFGFSFEWSFPLSVRSA